jgi:hypothetical protein
MRFKFLSLSLFSVSTLFALATATTKPAFAVCTTTDVNVQVAASKNPAQQENENTVERDEECFGNNSTHTSTQVGKGDNVNQRRRSEHRQGGSSNDKLRELGVETPNIDTGVDVRVNVPNADGALQQRR